MPATSTRTSTCRTEPRRGAAATTLLLLTTAGAAPAHAALRLDPQLRPAPREDRASVPQPTSPLELRLDRMLPAPRGEGPAKAPFLYEERLVEVDLNEQGINKSVLVLRRSDGMFMLPHGELASFRLKTPSTAPYIQDDVAYFPVDALPGARFVFDEARQRLAVTAGPDAFEATLENVPRGAAYAAAVRPSPGGFLNYQLSAVRGGGTGFEFGNFEAGLFSKYGVLVNTVTATRDADSTHVVRLESTYTADFPALHDTLRVGDSVARPGAWGNAVRFGGVQFGTNFSTEPGFLTFPTQAVRGQAVVPSLVDVYVNNALVATRQVDPGPFAISNIPFTSGSGTVRLIVRDVNNREQVVTVLQPFYSANTMLKAGLSDYSFEAGKVREDFGIESSHYGESFAAGTFRHGFSNALTAEARGESTRDVHAAGLSASYLHALIGQLDATFAASHAPDGAGQLAGLAFQRLATPFTIGGQIQWASERFRRVGQLPGESVPRLQAAASAGLQSDRAGSFTLTYVTQQFRDRAGNEIVAFGYGLPLGRWGQLNVSALKTFGEDNGYSVTAGVTVPLAANMSATAQLETAGARDDRERRATFSFQRNRSNDSPWSYRAIARGEDLDGAVQYRANAAEFEVEATRIGNGPVVTRAEVTGGVGYVGGYAFASRRITGSFGVVQVADYPGVGILFENQYVGRTNARGFFVIPELRPYDRNQIAVRETDLPLDATVGALKIDASPYFRSGLLVEFPVRRVRAGVLYLQLESGFSLPSGALVHIEGQSETFPVALHGEVYLTGFTDRNRLVATWKGASCTIEVVYPETTDPLPDLGRHICRGVKP
jgi:outer membrane usher protein